MWLVGWLRGVGIVVGKTNGQAECLVSVARQCGGF